MNSFRFEMTGTTTIGLIAVLIAALSAPVLATTYYVHPGGAGDYTTIQQAINACLNGDTVLVADGNYTGINNQDINFGGRNIVVRSENGTDNCVVNLTGTVGHRGFIFNSGEDPSAVLEGFTIRGGWVDPGSGGGILVSNASPVIRGNVIKRTVAQGSYTSPGWAHGGGIALYNSNANVVNNTIDSCSVEGSWTGGGGIYCSGGMPFISGNTISNNSTAGYGSYGGGGICSRSASPIITDNYIFNNRTAAQGSGGGIYCFGNDATIDTLRIYNNVIKDNDGPRSASGGEGGGIYTDYSHVYIVNNVVEGNNEDGLYCDTWAIVRNCIFNLNTGTEIANDYRDVAYCWLQGQSYVGGGPGNINGASITWESGPLGDFYYDPSHECNDAGNTSAAGICFQTVDGLMCMDDMTTSPNQVLDAGIVNMGVHYRRVPFTIYVPDHYATIQEAINAAWDDDSVCVRAGTYPETITFLGKPIPVFSESGPGATTIDGNSAGAVVTFNNGEGPVSILEGFTITDGHAGSGGGIFCWYASPTIRDMIVSENVADYDGGGIYISHGSPSIEDAIVTGNTSESGGGIKCSEGSPYITGCEITQNQAYHGGGLNFYNSTPIVINTTIDGNTATGFGGGGGGGGGLSMSSGGSPYAPIIQYCIFSNNVAQNAGGTGGGLTFGININPTIDHCTFYGNTAEIGAGIHVFGSTANVTNTIIAFNKTGEAVACESGGTANMSCCDVYNNDGGDWVGCIAGQETSNHNKSKDPIFCDAYNGDFGLYVLSPCSPTINPICGRIGALGVNCFDALYTVNDAGTGDFPTIQAAIDGAKGGQVIELADGTYTGTGNRDIYYWGKSVTVRSASGNPGSCIIDCQASASDTHRGFIVSQREGSGAKLLGVTVRNAYTTAAGGGMLIQRSRPVVTNCIFENCFSTDGSGIFNSIGSATTVEDCMFIGNSATNAGGGLRNTWAHVDVTNCVFIGNWANWGGGGMYNYYSQGDVDGCVFVQNTCDHWGGGLHNDRAESSITITNTTFADNGAPVGGAIYNRREANIVISNTIIASSTEGEAVWCDPTSSATLSCCDVYGNAGGDYVGCLAGQGTVNDNFSENPHFCNPASDDYHLGANSPCAAANNPACGLVGALDTGCGYSKYVVKPDGTGDYPTIAEAIQACADYDTVEMTDGTFSGTGNRDLNFDGKKIYMRSQSDDPRLCIIDCEGSDGDYHQGFVFNSGEDRYSQLRGVQIINAYAHPQDLGGAIECTNGSSPTITNCIFAYCYAPGGAGVSCNLGSSPLINLCTFYRNENALGGALWCYQGSSPTVSYCTFFRSYPWAISSSTDCEVEVFNTIISWTTLGVSVACFNNGTIEISESNVYANEGGDWVGCIAGQEGSFDNMSTDPLFCDTTDVALTLQDNSPCAQENTSFGRQVGAWGIDCTATGIESEAVPVANRLHQCYPNPFNPTTTIAFELKDPAAVTLRVYDAAGRLVRSLVDENRNAGRYHELWDGRDNRGRPAASGVYFCRLTAGPFMDSRKMLLLK